MSDPTLPSAELLRQQAAWLAPARSRLLRRAGIAHCRRVLDLGCGSGAVTEELARRAAGPVVALDCSRVALAQLSGAHHCPLYCVLADAARLPLAAQSFDLVFCQFTLLWVNAAAAVGEIHRVLVPGGRLVAIEPDYAGMIEHPPNIATRGLWLAGVARAGGDGTLGRKLPGMLTAAGFNVRVDLLDRLERPSPARFELLGELPLEPGERQALAAAQAVDRCLAAMELQGEPSPRVAHLPVFLVTATKPS